MTTWKEQLNNTLIQQYGEKKGDSLYKKYAQAFDEVYCNESSIELTLNDILYLEKLSPDNFLDLNLYFSLENQKQEKKLHLRIFQWEKQIPLSDILPLLSDLGFRVMSERSYRVEVEKKAMWISDFIVSCSHSDVLQFKETQQLFHDAFIEILSGDVESDAFNKLILRAQLSWREITIFRAYAKYLRQVGFRFSELYIQQALNNNEQIARELIAFFKARHDPQKKLGQKNQADQIEEKILQMLDQVVSLDEDRIMRRLLVLIKATVRTNYYQPTKNGNYKEYLSFKLLSHAIPDLPLPVPLYEIFVYSSRFEGIHLRNTKVARGGIRWSDRREDFRTEILGLMKAQRVKNAIIVPSGAKGGFVLKSLSSTTSRDTVQKEVVTCYQLFIRGLLDLTDNVKEGQPSHPLHTICHDDFDPYFVVAADKGTATFSDIANQISQEYHFWLGDAFASGGATGYDHKKMGITARGAWESVKRHFRGLDINIEKTVITVVGIGDMSGDVFGNGMIYSKNLKLVGAFDHRHVFLDPDPDPEVSYHERLRLFKMAGSSWGDYNNKLLSAGGGIYKRSVKAIEVSPEIKKLFNIQENSLTPNDMIQALLKAPVDLLWNGGIGTYVKASTESHGDVGDKTNDLNRVDGKDLNCKVVGEGGNLGFTQQGRIEYALEGGLINTDFIDNSAGVDCSDHEVNLKILLDTQVAKGKLSEKKRNQLLTDVTQEVATLVLSDNFYQAWIMGFLAFYSKHNTSIYQGYIKDLEAAGHLNRQIEFLPDDKTLLERKNMGVGLTRPELAVLLAYTKIYIKNEILSSTLLEDRYFGLIMETAFPRIIDKTFQRAEQEHSLRHEIMATQLSNRVINEMGIVFVYHLQTETGATVSEIIRAHTMASFIFESQKMQKIIESLDFKIPVDTQYELLYHVRHLITISTRWFLHNHRSQGNIPDIIEHYNKRVKQLHEWVLDLMTGYTKTFLETLTDQFLKAGLTKELARHIASYRVLYTALNIIEVATKHNFDLIQTAKMYFKVGERFNLVWFRDQIANDVREGSWHSLARMTLRDELDILQKELSVEMIKENKKEENISKLISTWLERNARALDRWQKLLRSIHESSTIDYTMFFVALRELRNLIQAK